MRTTTCPDDIYMYMPEPYNLIAEICIRTGLRISDVLKMQYKHILLKQPYIKETKTGKTRRIFIGVKLRKKIIVWAERNKLKQDDFAFAKKHGGKPPCRQTIYRHFKIAAEKYGIDPGHIGCHSARRAYAHNKHRTGMSLKRIQNKMNHNNIETTILYLFDEETTEKKSKGGKKKGAKIK